MSDSRPATGIGQLVFARLERHQSRRRREGFQTAGATSGFLGPGDEEAIEERLAFFPSAGRNSKRVFFTAPSGLFVVARIIALPDRDASGRGGNYLAHALLIPPAVFHSVDANPFVFLDQAPFFEGLADALAAVDPATGSLPPLAWQPERHPSSPEIRLTAETRSIAAGFPFRTPLELAPRSARDAARDASREGAGSDRIALTGDEQEIAATLRAVWPLMPAAWRPHGSFDTDFEGCNAAATRYWATGQRAASSAAVAAGRPRGDSQQAVEVTPYAAWVRWRLRTSPTAWTVAARDTAERYCHLLADSSIAVELTDAALVGEIVAANRSLIRRLLMRGLRDTLRHHHIPSLPLRWRWRRRTWRRRLTPRLISAVIDYLFDTRESPGHSSASLFPDAGELPAEFAVDALAWLWAAVADELLANDSPKLAFQLACGLPASGASGSGKRAATGSAGFPSASRWWSAAQLTASLRAVARRGGLPRNPAIRETLSQWIRLSGDLWLLAWYTGWSRGLTGGPVWGAWKRYRFRMLLRALPAADSRDVVDTLWRQQALARGRQLDAAEAAALRDQLLTP